MAKKDRAQLEYERARRGVPGQAFERASPSGRSKKTGDTKEIRRRKRMYSKEHLERFLEDLIPGFKEGIKRLKKMPRLKKRMFPTDKQGRRLYKHGRGRGDPHYGLGMEDPRGYEDIKKGGKIKKKNYAKGGGERPASY